MWKDVNYNIIDTFIIDNVNRYSCESCNICNRYNYFMNFTNQRTIVVSNANNSCNKWITLCLIMHRYCTNII